MLRVLVRKEEKILRHRKKKRRGKEESWFLYILRCSDGTLYTGITKDLERRLKMHNDGKGASYTRTRRPVTLLYQEHCRSRTQALVRECAIKSLPREKKLSLINVDL
ncbi:MAG: GIY-YIG nuclease family protein [Candidatus Omnitrophica bacterium]|nr:GIY-YIG nuclease family protein [Candidatus Omnitrophota bacterium]